MYNDDVLNLKAPNEILLLNNNYPIDILWIGCRNNCISFIKKIFNNNNKLNIDDNNMKRLYETSLVNNNIKISSYLFEYSQNVIYKDIFLKCILNNSKKAIRFLKNKNIKIDVHNEEYIVSECLRIGNYKLAKNIIKTHNIEYSNLMYYIYVKTINIKMLIWLLNKIDNKTEIKYINIFNYINCYEFRKILKIAGDSLLKNIYFDKCKKLKKHDICKSMIDNNFVNENNVYYNNIKIIKIV